MDFDGVVVLRLLNRPLSGEQGVRKVFREIYL